MNNIAQTLLWECHQDIALSLAKGDWDHSFYLMGVNLRKGSIGNAHIELLFEVLDLSGEFPIHIS